MFTDPWALDGSLNAYGSLGIHVAADGTVDDAWQGLPAFIAGVTPASPMARRSLQ